MHRKSRSAVAAAVCLLFAACRTGSVPNQRITKPAPATVAPAMARAGGPWDYRRSTSRQGFVIEQRAVVSIKSDTTIRTDTISSHAEVSFTAAQSGTTVAGSVAVFLVAGGGRAPAAPAGLALPFSFRAEYPARGLQLEFSLPRDAVPCASLELAASQALRDLWFRPPDTLKTGMLWQDSTSYVLCRDGVPLRATTNRTFRVATMTEREGRILLTITRLSRTVVAGAGAQFGEPVTISGAGSGQLTYVLDPANGEIVSASGASGLDLSLRSRLRAQQVRQDVEIRISRN